MLLSARGEPRPGDGPSLSNPGKGIRHQVRGASHVPAETVLLWKARYRDFARSPP
jgi:hypothetical protein